jgi:hypothetical protein
MPKRVNNSDRTAGRILNVVGTNKKVALVLSSMGDMSQLDRENALSVCVDALTKDVAILDAEAGVFTSACSYSYNTACSRCVVE